MSQSLASSPKKLTPRETIYVQSRLAGLTQIASAAAAGCPNPRVDGNKLEQRSHVQAAIMSAMNELAEEVGFTRKEAHEMLMSAYQNAATAAEQIQAVKEMINLHGIAAPKVIEHEHKHTGKISLDRMPEDELMKLAGMQDLVLEGECKDVTDDATKKLQKL